MDQLTIASRVKVRNMMRDRGKKRKRIPEKKNYIMLSDDSDPAPDPDPVPKSEAEEQRDWIPSGDDNKPENTATSDKTLSENESQLVRRRVEKNRRKYGSDWEQPSLNKGKSRASSSMRSAEKSKSGSYSSKHRGNEAHLSMDSGDTKSVGPDVMVFGSNRPGRRNKKAPVGDGIEYVKETVPESNDIISEASKDYQFTEYVRNYSDEQEELNKYMSGREVEVETEDYDWRDIGKASAEFQLPSSSVSRRKHAEFQEPVEPVPSKSKSKSRRSHHDFQELSDSEPRKSKSKSRRSHHDFQELSDHVPRNSKHKSRRSHHDFQELSDHVPRNSKSKSRRSHHEFQELSDHVPRKSKSKSRRSYHDFQEPSGSMAERYYDDFQVPNEPRRYRDDFHVSSESRRYCNGFLKPRNPVPERYRDEYLKPRRYSEELPETSGFRSRRYSEELPRKPSDFRSRRYHHTAFQEPPETMRRRKHAEYQEPIDTRSRRYCAQPQKARKSMHRREHEREHILPVPVRPAGRDVDIDNWMKNHFSQTTQYFADTKDYAAAEDYEEPRIMKSYENIMEDEKEEEEMETEETDEEEEEEFAEYEEKEDDDDDDEEEEEEEEEEAKAEAEEEEEVNNRALRTRNQSNDGIVLVKESVGPRNFQKKGKRIRGRQLQELQAAVALEISESSKAAGAESQIPVPVPVKEELVDEEEFKLAAKESENAEPIQNAETQTPAVIVWTETSTAEVRGRPAQETLDYDEIGARQPSSSSAAGSSDTDHDDADYKVGEESDEGENIVIAEAEESEAATKEEDFVVGENRRFKRLRKGLPHAETSVDLQDHILGAIFGNANAQADAAPTAIPEEVMAEANSREDTPAAYAVADDMTEENATPLADGTPEDDTMEPDAEEGTLEVSKESKADSGAEGPVEFSKEIEADSGAEASQAAESSPAEVSKESEAASGENAMVEEKTEETSAAAEFPPTQVVENGHTEEGTAASIGTPSEKAGTEKIPDDESATAESTKVKTVENGLVEENDKVVTEKISEKESPAAESTPEEVFVEKHSEERTTATDGTPREKLLEEESSPQGETVEKTASANDESTPEEVFVEKHAEEGTTATDGTPREKLLVEESSPQGETVEKTASANDGSGTPAEKPANEEDKAAAENTPGDANSKQGKGAADEPLCYRPVLPNEKRSSEKSTTRVREKPPVDMEVEGRPRVSRRSRPPSADVNRESRKKRSRSSQEIVWVGETDINAPQHPRISRGHHKAGSSRRPHHHHTEKSDEVVMVAVNETTATPHQAPPLAPVSRPETSIGHRAVSSGRRARPERSISQKATSSDSRARNGHQAPSLALRPRPESSSGHRDPSSRPRARPESSAVSSGKRARPETSNSPLAHPEVQHSSQLKVVIESSSHQAPDLGNPERDSGKESEEDEEEEEEEIEESPGPKEKKLVTDLMRSIVGEEDEAQQEPLVEPSSWNGPTLPKKFRFPDEDPKPVKSEYDDMVGELFLESGMHEGRFGYEDEPPQQEEIREEEPQKEAEPSCRHEFYIQEPIGRICRLCLHIETEMRYIDHEFAQDPLRFQRSGDHEKITKLKGIDFSPEEADQSEDAFSADVGTVWDAIPGAKSRMYEHQQEGFEFMWKNLEGTINLAELKKSEDSDIGGCIISHAPGTGKTLLTLMFINAYLKIFPNSRPMIIAPASMLLTWEEEFKKWNMDFPFHNLNHVELTGKERKIQDLPAPTGRALDKDVTRLIKIYSWTKGRSVLGISYNLFENLVGGEYKKVRSIKQKLKKKKKVVKPGQRSQKYKKMLLEMPRLVIMDEGHTPRNSNSCIWNTVLKLQTKRKIILTGTPFQNNFMELFNTLRLVRPETADSLLKERCIAPMLAGKGGKYAPKKKQMEGSETDKEPSVDKAIVKLKDIISPFVHVHKGYILKRSLPGLKDSVLLLKPPPMQKHLIKLIEGSKGVSSFDYEYKVALLSTHPCLAEYCTLEDRERAAINMAEVVSLKDDYKEGVKTKFVMELVRLSIDHGEKVLVFSQYQQVHKLMDEQLRAHFNWEEGRQVIQMHGKQDQKHRQQLITKFNDPKSEAVVLLASTKCCSEGINLVGASRVVLLDVVWNPSVERQAISRAYRLGQKKVVHTYHLMAAGTTEGDKYCRQVEKDRLSELVFSSTTKEVVPEQDPALGSASATVTASASGVGDVILQSMLEDVNFKDMVEKIIYQPKEVNLIESFTLASAEA